MGKMSRAKRVRKESREMHSEDLFKYKLGLILNALVDMSKVTRQLKQYTEAYTPEEIMAIGKVNTLLDTIKADVDLIPDTSV